MSRPASLSTCEHSPHKSEVNWRRLAAVEGEAGRGAGISTLRGEFPMLKKILAFVMMLYAAAAFAAVDVNTAKAAELDSVKGIGPTMSQRILDERKKSKFKDWPDLIERVKGLGET